jgi:hypothetical protein
MKNRTSSLLRHHRWNAMEKQIGIIRVGKLASEKFARSHELDELTLTARAPQVQDAPRIDLGNSSAQRENDPGRPPTAKEIGRCRNMALVEWRKNTDDGGGIMVPLDSKISEMLPILWRRAI